MIAAALVACFVQSDGNRLTYLDEADPYYVSRRFPKLTTPQWVGEEGVEAVVVLAIDDMRGHDRWEAYLRPILERLKKIDGRAPVSIMTCVIDPHHPHLQKWLGEGLSLECHTYDHPCPILQKDDFPKAKGTYDRCVDLLSSVPNSKPVAFRTPCCDSLNTPSPRLYSEIFNKTSGKGNFLTIDTSVFNIATPNDPELPRELVVDADGREKFRKYLPFPSFVNTIEDYPYPYVIGRLCWQFPCAVPSDWEAQYLRKPYNPLTVRDLEAVIDITVIKKGVFNLVFHPHGWIRNEQVIELIDYAVARHGRKVKFLNFREAQERLDKNLLAGHPLRAANGQDNGVRLLDLDRDGYLDVVIGNENGRLTRVWDPGRRAWADSHFPTEIVEVDVAKNRWNEVRFGVLRRDGLASFGGGEGVWHFEGGKWVPGARTLRSGFNTSTGVGQDSGTRLRDLDGDGICERITGTGRQRDVLEDLIEIHQLEKEGTRWIGLPFTLPRGTGIADDIGRDRGLRFVDLNGDGRDDIVYSNEEAWSVHVFVSMEKGWELVKAGKRGDPGEIPMIIRRGTNNGAWFHSSHLWVQNENTGAKLKDHVDRRSFADLLQR